MFDGSYGTYGTHGTNETNVALQFPLCLRGVSSYPARPVRWFAYMASRLLLKLILALVARTIVLHRERTLLPGGWILAANHISHFDPPFLGVACLRKMDWMTSREFYDVPVLGAWMRAVDTFPVDRERPDRAAIRAALARLAAGRVIGLFPEGGIRDGARSRRARRGTCAPVCRARRNEAASRSMPCVILGSDRLYACRACGWPFRPSRGPGSVFGEPLRLCRRGQGRAGGLRGGFRTLLSKALLAEMRTGALRTDPPEDLPQPAGRRKGREI